MTQFEASTGECYTLVTAKRHVEDLFTICQKMENNDHLMSLLRSLYSELEYKHDVLRSPELSQLATSKSRYFAKRSNSDNGHYDRE